MLKYFFHSDISVLKVEWEMCFFLHNSSEAFQFLPQHPIFVWPTFLPIFIPLSQTKLNAADGGELLLWQALIQLFTAISCEKYKALWTVHDEKITKDGMQGCLIIITAFRSVKIVLQLSRDWQMIFSDNKIQNDEEFRGEMLKIDFLF